MVIFSLQAASVLGCCHRFTYLNGCSILFAGEIPDPQEGMWQLNTLGRERHLLQGPPAPDFLPFVVEPILFSHFPFFLLLRLL